MSLEVIIAPCPISGDPGNPENRCRNCDNVNVSDREFSKEKDLCTSCLNHYFSPSRENYKPNQHGLPIVTQGNEKELIATQHPEILIGQGFLDHNDGTATDIRTGLRWMRFAVGQLWVDGTAVGQIARLDSDAANAIPKNSMYSNYYGRYLGLEWRLPKPDEVHSILTYCRIINAWRIIPDVFKFNDTFNIHASYCKYIEISNRDVKSEKEETLYDPIKRSTVVLVR